MTKSEIFRMANNFAKTMPKSEAFKLAYSYARIDESSKKLVEVVFIKKDGTERVLRGTKNLQIVPKESHPKGTSNAVKPNDLITLFDLEKKAWRSFYKKSIIHAKYI